LAIAVAASGVAKRVGEALAAELELPSGDRRGDGPVAQLR